MEPKKISHFKRARLLIKAASATLKADKELVLIPLVSFFIGLFVFIVGIVAIVLLNYLTRAQGSIGWDFDLHSWASYLGYVVMYITMAFISTFTAAALFAGATMRFRGEDASVKQALTDAKAKIKPLFVYSLFIGTIGLILQTIENRVPLAGKITVWLFNAVWSVANIFSIPVIMSSKEDVTPLQATRGSVQIIKKVWGENAIAQMGVGIIALLYIVGVMVFGAILGSLVPSNATIGINLIVPILMVIALFVIGIVFSTLSAIVRAAVFHYATTGESPDQFSEGLLKQTMTIKKSRKIFAGR